MNKFIKTTVAALGMVAMTAGLAPSAHALSWVISPDANAWAFGQTVVAGVDQVTLGPNPLDVPGGGVPQPTGIYGAGFMINGSSASVDFDADLYSWDAYNAPTEPGTGYWDAFIVTISQVGYYWNLMNSDPVSTSASTWAWGGTNFNDGILESYTTGPGGMDNVTLASGPGDYYVSFVLDTKTLPNADTKHPSWGSFHVSVVPEPETYAMMLAGLGLLGFAARRRKSENFESKIGRAHV